MSSATLISAVGEILIYHSIHIIIFVPCFGLNAGAAINPAWELAPRILSIIIIFLVTETDEYLLDKNQFRGNKTGFNLLIFHFTILRYMSIIRYDNIIFT